MGRQRDRGSGRWSTVAEAAEAQAEDRAALRGEIAGIRHSQAEMFKIVERVISRAEEEDRREAEFQQANLELGRELRDLAREAARENREARAGRQERRTPMVSRRYVYVASAVVILLALLAVVLTVIDIYVHVTP